MHTASRSRICRCMADGEIHLYLPKGSKGTLWPAVFKGHTQVHGLPLQLPERALAHVCAFNRTQTEPARSRVILSDSAAVPSQVDPFTRSELQKGLMLQRFQAENPGFDFSGATFNGQVPDTKTFMGGIGYNN